MALLDNILNNNELADANKKAANDAQSKMNVPSPEQLNSQNASDPYKPQNMSDEDFKYLSAYMPKEDIKRMYAPFDPNSGENYFQRLYTSTQSKPQPIDENKARNQRTIAGIAQGLGTIAQMFGASKGAYVKGGVPDVLGAAKQNEQNERNKYIQQSQSYNSGLVNSAVQDYTKNMNDYQNGRKAIQSILANKTLREQQQSQFNSRLKQSYDKMAQDAEKNKLDYDLKVKGQKDTNNYRNAQLGISRQNANNNTRRTNAYIQKLKSGGSSGGYQLTIPANPNDTNAVTQFGNKVRTYPMTKGQMDLEVRNAKADKDFLNSPEGKSIIKKKGGQNVLTGLNEPDQYIPDADIAASYIKYKYYDPQFSNKGNTTSKNTSGVPGFNGWGNSAPLPIGSEADEEDEFDSYIIN